MVYGDFKHLTRRTGAYKVLCVWPFSIAKNSKDDGNKCRLASMVYKLFYKKLLVVLLRLHNEGL